jgi:hypothetical protein
MMRFFLGVVCGLAIGVYLWRNPTAGITQLENTNPVAKSLKKGSTINSINPETDSTNKPAVQVGPEQVKISLDYNSIKSLEDSISTLEDQAEVHRTESGWVFKSLKNDSLLYAIGFRPQDEIPSDISSEYFSGNVELKQRFLKVMDYLAR